MTIYKKFALAFDGSLMDNYLKSEFVKKKLDESQLGDLGQLSRLFDEIKISDDTLISKMLHEAQRTKNFENHLNKVFSALLDQLLNGKKTDFKLKINDLFDPEMLRQIKLLCSYYNQSYMHYMIQALIASYAGLLTEQFAKEQNDIIQSDSADHFNRFNESISRPINRYAQDIKLDKIISSTSSTIITSWFLKQWISFLFLSTINRRRPLEARARKVSVESFYTVIKLQNYLFIHQNTLSSDNIELILKSIKIISKQCDQIDDMLIRLAIPMIDDTRGQEILDNACKQIASTVVNHLLPIHQEQLIVVKNQGRKAWLSYQINQWLEPEKNISSISRKIIHADSHIYQNMRELKGNLTRSEKPELEKLEVELKNNTNK